MNDRNRNTPLEHARRIAAELEISESSSARVEQVQSLIQDVDELAEIDHQGPYEDAHERLANAVIALDDSLSKRRFLAGDEPGFADLLLFAFSVRLDLVYYELHKASVGLLTDYPDLLGHAQDLFEIPAVWQQTDFDAIKRDAYLGHALNPKNIVPRGGTPDLDAPHFRAEAFQDSTPSAVEEDQERSRGEGEWVRPQSELRHWIRSEPNARYPAEVGRYHLYAPFNCPWSHRALLARSVKGLDEIVGASIVYFRRDPDHGWQFNPAIPGCTKDRAEGCTYVEELYEAVGSDERSVPVLWDTKSQTVVNNESAEILRMFNDAFEGLAARSIDLYPEKYQAEIERINALVYHRVNNGAYKAGFALSQAAYERAFSRYFRALEWLDELLEKRTWLAGTPELSEADLRLFPTLFRHDAIYFSRFKLNASRLEVYPRLVNWLERMNEVPGVDEASNLDHARNGYFGRTGNEIVPAGPLLLELSRRDYSDDTWLNPS